MKYELGAMAVDTDGNARPAATDGQDNLLNQVGPGMGKGNAVLDNTNGSTLTLSECVVLGKFGAVAPDINGPFTAHHSMVVGVFYP